MLGGILWLNFQMNCALIRPMLAIPIRMSNDWTYWALKIQASPTLKVPFWSMQTNNLLCKLNSGWAAHFEQMFAILFPSRERLMTFEKTPSRSAAGTSGFSLSLFFFDSFKVFNEKRREAKRWMQTQPLTLTRLVQCSEYIT